MDNLGAVALLALLITSSSGGPQAIAQSNSFADSIPQNEKTPPLSGSYQFRGEDYGTGLTECPQAGIKPVKQPQPLDRREKDKVEQLSERGNEQRANAPDYSCFPQNETSIDVNPVNPRNAVAGANDYRLGWGTSGFYATTDNGNNWYSQLIPAPSVANDDHLDGGGDPAIVYDRAGVVYYAQIRFERERADNGIFVNRSSNGGFTWSRPCVPVGGRAGGPPPHEGATCGAPGDVRAPGDGVVSFNPDPDGTGPAGAPFDDKEYIAAGPRPAGVEPVCFTAISRAPRACSPTEVGVDRVYVTWTRFEGNAAAPFGFTANIYLSYSDDQGRSWSPPRAISGSAPFCIFGAASPNACDLNQFSVPTVSVQTGLLGVAFQNFNTPDEHQYLFVRSRDGGQTFEGPFFVTPIFDVNYPRAGAAGGRPDCTARGQQAGRAVLTNSCFRVNAGGAVVADRRSGEFADDFYLVISDNRNGTRASSNTDVFLFASKDGGTTWIGPTRVNDDASQQPANRNCGRSEQPPCEPGAVFGNDQWFPWIDISDHGDLNVNFYDRRLDTNSTAHEWPTSRQRPGNYLVWRFGAVCRVTTTGLVTQDSTSIPASAAQCLAPTAQIIRQPAAPVDPGNDSFPEQTVFPLRNFTLSDVPSNWDYSFRAGIFAGDYDVVAVGPNGSAWAMWTDARNGRSSRNQAGRNPICEQSDAFFELYGAASGGAVKTAQPTDEAFLVTPCPADAADHGLRSP